MKKIHAFAALGLLVAAAAAPAFAADVGVSVSMWLAKIGCVPASGFGSATCGQ